MVNPGAFCPNIQHSLPSLLPLMGRKTNRLAKKGVYSDEFSPELVTTGETGPSYLSFATPVLCCMHRPGNGIHTCLSRHKSTILQLTKRGRRNVRHVRDRKHHSDAGPSYRWGVHRVSAASELPGYGVARDAPFSLVGEYRYSCRVHRYLPWGGLLRPGCPYL